MKRLLLLVLIAAAALFVSTARAGDPPADAKTEEVRTKLFAVLLDEGRADERAKAAGDLLSLNTPAAAKAALDALDKLAARATGVDVRLARTRADYEAYKGSQKNDKDWAIKQRLLEQMEKDEAISRGDVQVLGAFGAGIAALADKEAVAVLDRAAGKDAEPRARLVLCAALLRNPLTNAAEAAKRGMADADAAVRLAVLQAMADRKDASFLALGLKALADPSWTFRQAAARLLAALGDVKAVGPIVTAMTGEDGRLLEDYADALARLTGEKLGPNPEAWKKWYDDHKAELAAKGAGSSAPKLGKNPLAPPVDYYGIQTRSRKLLFLIDCSGSMNEVLGKPSVTGGGYSGPKIEIAKKMLKAAITQLDPSTQFNVIVFSTDARQFNEGLIPATPINKAATNEKIDELAGRGGTYTYGALRLAFGLANPNVSPSAPPVDTIFLLSDGAPTEATFEDGAEAKPMDPDKILTAVRQWNPFRAIKIHTIAIDPRIDSPSVGQRFIRFMRDLAGQNDGTYTAIGEK